MSAERKRERSCLALTISAALDGGIFGAAIGAIMASGAALQAGFTHGGFRLMLRSGFASAISVGGFLASYNGGVCAMEKLRKRRDAINPAIVGGIMGVAGAVPGYLFVSPQAPWAYRNPRALVGSGLTSALLCSFLWSMSRMGDRPIEQANENERTVPSSSGKEPSIPSLVPNPMMSMPVLPASLPKAGPYAEPSDSVDNTREDEINVFASDREADQPSAVDTEVEENGEGGEQLQDPWARK